MNLGRWDRVLRIVLGTGALGVGWAGMLPDWWAVVCKLFGLYPLLTGVLGWDPLYALARFRTSP
jgi:Inner membrane protein YgaP-like, transmembrane domain